MRLFDCLASRDNNLNLLRITAALVVLFSHSFSLLLQAEPIEASTGSTLGNIAVDVFFIISGLLVTGSLVKSNSVVDYACSRILRIYPALLFMLLLTVFILFPIYTTVPLAKYFLAPETRLYLLKCATLFSGVVYRLPGVFEQNPYPYFANGSLWTMPVEIKMYAILLVVWYGSVLLNRRRKNSLPYLILPITVVAAILVFVNYFYLNHKVQFIRLFFMFFSGVSLFVLRERLVLTRQVFYPVLLLVLGAAFVNKAVFFVLYNLTIAYLVVCIAYLPSGWIRRYNNMGDYSYGVYIYAFPVQQAVAASFPGIPVLGMVGASATVTLMLAIFSWHKIEKPSLALRVETVARLRKYWPSKLKKPTRHAQ
ncbi:acyltransferase family protein [Undibacterium sp. Di27W]|uniref:acyltransferase family protein n=1 Tax=Undibacterium sp. Di27W TaxID=3413036 RepID=UPI003BF4437D